MLVGALEGAMLVARAYRSSDRFDDTARRLLADLCASNDRAAPVPREARGKQRRRQKRASE